ncbi:MAG: maleylpyruvate isomerase family mycothiol-dependent enzyme [Actinomycetota bacterium]
MSKELGELMEQAWSSMEELCSQLGPSDWDLPTDCPGWNVKDQLAHICALESRALGREQPASGPRKAGHTRNELGELNEGDLEARRGLSPEELLAEYRDVTAERGTILASWTDEDWKSEGKGVLGTAPRDQIIRIRIVDVFTHEQDIRVATAKPGHLSGGVARLVFEQVVGTLGYVLVKRAGATEGQTAVFEIGPPGETFAYTVTGGRGTKLDQIPQDPAVRLAMDAETFLRLYAGRWSVERVEQEGRVRIAGDHDLARRIMAGMNVTP